MMQSDAFDGIVFLSPSSFETNENPFPKKRQRAFLLMPERESFHRRRLFETYVHSCSCAEASLLPSAAAVFLGRAFCRMTIRTRRSAREGRIWNRGSTTFDQSHNKRISHRHLLTPRLISQRRIDDAYFVATPLLMWASGAQMEQTPLVLA